MDIEFSGFHIIVQSIVGGRSLGPTRTHPVQHITSSATRATEVWPSAVGEATCGPREPASNKTVTNLCHHIK